MKAKRKTALMIACGAAVLILLAVLSAGLFFDINSFKPKIEAAVSEASGLRVGINGRMRLQFFPFGLTAQDIHVAGRGGEFLTVERIALRLEFLPLLKKRLQVTDCQIVTPTVTIVRDAQGKYNFEREEEKPPEAVPGSIFSLRAIDLSKGTLVYLNRQTGGKTELRDIDLALREFAVADGPGAGLQNVSFAGSIVCRELQNKNLKIADIRSLVTAEKGILAFKSLTMEIFGAKGEGNATANCATADAEYILNVKVPKSNFEELATSFGLEKRIGGKGDLAVSLTMRDKEGHSLLSGLNGTLSLQGRNLITSTVDLDEVLSAYETSHKFNLVDIGAYFIAGPLGSVAMRAYRYGDVYYQMQGGRGTIRQFASHWKIKSGVAETVDCALATEHHRVALKGKLDLVHERFDHMTVAILDGKGCALFLQGISGSFDSPQIGVASAIGSLAAPIVDAYKRLQRFLKGGKCEAFYSGSVEQPR